VRDIHERLIRRSTRAAAAADACYVGHVNFAANKDTFGRTMDPGTRAAWLGSFETNGHFKLR